MNDNGALRARSRGHGRRGGMDVTEVNGTWSVLCDPMNSTGRYGWASRGRGIERDGHREGGAGGGHSRWIEVEGQGGCCTCSRFIFQPSSRYHVLLTITPGTVTITPYSSHHRIMSLFPFRLQLREFPRPLSFPRRHLQVPLLILLGTCLRCSFLNHQPKHLHNRVLSRPPAGHFTRMQT